MDELYQTEWCPVSRRVRQRLTELGRAGGEVIVGADAILAHLDLDMVEPDTAAAHRGTAARARRRYLQEECS